VGGDDGLRNRQAHAQPARLGAEKRFEDTLEVLLGNPGARIADCHLDAGGDSSDTHGNASLQLRAAAHRIHRVEEEIEQHLLQLDAVGPHRRHRGCHRSSPRSANSCRCRRLNHEPASGSPVMNGWQTGPRIPIKIWLPWNCDGNREPLFSVTTNLPGG
jgi:hypothetical protein